MPTQCLQHTPLVRTPLSYSVSIPIISYRRLSSLWPRSPQPNETWLVHFFVSICWGKFYLFLADLFKGSGNPGDRLCWEKDKMSFFVQHWNVTEALMYSFFWVYKLSVAYRPSFTLQRSHIEVVWSALRPHPNAWFLTCRTLALFTTGRIILAFEG